MPGPSPTAEPAAPPTTPTPPAPTPPERLVVIRDPAQARSLLDPLRREILRHLEKPGSAAAVARALDLPRQRLNYHVRELERDGLLVHREDRRRGNCVERVLQASARCYVIDPAIVGSGEASAGDSNPFESTDLLARAARSLREVAELEEQASAAGRRLPTLTLETRIRFRSAEDQVEFARAVQDLFDQMADRYDRPDAPEGRTFRISLAGHPVAEEATQ